MPNLSDLANAEITLNDLDDILDQELTNYNTSYSRNESSNNDESMESMQAIPRSTEDPFKNEMLSILNNDINTSNVEENYNVDPNIVQSHNTVDQYYKPGNDVEAGGVDPYALAFDLIQEMDLIRLPEGIGSLSQEEINFYKEQTLIQQRDEALEFLRSQVSHDPFMLEIFDYTMVGGNFADIPTFKALTNVEIDYETININDEDNQRGLVAEYLSSDLNPNSKKDRELLSYIPEKIERLYETGTLKQKAIEAKDHFIGRLQQEKEYEFQKAIERRQAFDYEQWREQQEQFQWDKEFKDTLIARKWSDAKKHNVVKESQMIQMEDGTTMPVWEYKRQIIFTDPYLFQQFLDFTSKLDLQQGDFINVEQSDEPDVSQSTINKILERAAQKSQTANRNSSTTNNKQTYNKQTEVRQVADPNQWF